MQTADNAYEGPGKLLIDYTEEDWEAARATATVEPGKLIELPLAVIIEDPANERADVMEDLEGLVESIRERGVIEPVLVFSLLAGERYMLKSGHRRRAAALKAGLRTIPAIIVEEPQGQDQAVDRLVANLQRKDLSAMEKARGFRAVLDQNPGLTQAELAKKLGVSQPVVANTMRLLGLPQQIRDWIEDGKLTPAHGVALLRVTEPQIDYYGKPVCTAEEWVLSRAKNWIDQGRTSSAAEREVADNLSWQGDNRKRVHERAKQEAEQKKAAEERAEKVAAGELPPEKTREELEEERRKQANAEGRARMARVRLAHSTMRDTLQVQAKTGPTVEHLRLAAHAINFTRGYEDQLWELPSKDDATTAIDACTHKPALVEWIVRLALGKLSLAYDGTRLGWGELNAWADKTWSLTGEVKTALQGAGLLDDNGKEVAA